MPGRSRCGWRRCRRSCCPSPTGNWTTPARSTQRLQQAGIRATLDDRNEKVNLKIREAQLQKIPYMLVVGDREAQTGTVSVRNRKHGDQGAKTLDAFLAQIRELIDAKSPAE